ncbi:MAG: NAD-dependent epimerase/dehydratase family protein [Phycisphaera sp.]|nr:NAD-dependent epimerase/dehydratase family protein [Phycisphaera sp.]
MPKTALITGITGQDGSYLAEHLLAQGYEVHGIVRRVALEDPSHRLVRIAPFIDRIHLHSATLENYPSLCEAMRVVKPDEVYHLAAQSFVAESFDDSFSTLSTNINGTHFILSALKAYAPEARMYFAGTSEMFGKVVESPQRETTPFRPRSPYGISKLAGYELVRNYREAYGLFACSGILFNHESPRRGYEFVTRKVTSHAAKIKLGKADRLELGNLDALRDWGHAKDYVVAMHLMLLQDQPDDYVIATGKPHSVRDMVKLAFDRVGLDWEKYVVINPRFVRPAEVDVLKGDPSKAKAQLGWTATTTFEQLVHEMVDSDLAALSR